MDDDGDEASDALGVEEAEAEAEEDGDDDAAVQ